MTRPTEELITYLIHQSNLIEGFDNKAMDANGLIAWDYLIRLPFAKLSNRHIQRVQEIIVTSQQDLQDDWRGKYRMIPVWIAGHEAMKAEHIERAMDELLVRYPFTLPEAWHIEFEEIHPFVDGNGRTGRLLLWWMQMNRSETLSTITNAQKHKYYDWFRNYD